MEHADRAGFAGYSVSNWAEDHAEGRFHVARAFTRALDDVTCAEDLEAADEELFEDDLLSLIQNRPSRHAQRN